jgi:valyl-tRNA synthetase
MNDNVPEKLLKPYDPAETEARIYTQWEESGLFNPDTCIEQGIANSEAPYFSIVLPPPNVTGRLHLGHALEHSIQDAAVRYHRMKGNRTLWIPGTDHAAIATQARFEKDLYSKEKKSRHDFSRTEFFNMVHEYGLENQKEMQKQMRLLGSSLDWSREAFTLDDTRSLAVRTAFKKMFDEGLIYRGYRVVNWDPKGQTTISDDEIVYEERKATLYTFKYAKNFPIAISTTRPETKVGDTAVAVHPDDLRYKEFVGKEYSFEFCGVPVTLKIIADKEVDPEFGTGALGVTPAHSMIDAEIAKRHNLPSKQVINEYAKMIVGDERILNKKTVEARETIVEWLRSEGLMIDEKEITQNISTAERTGGIVEPLPKLQWFIDVNKPVVSRDNKSLKELMRQPVESGIIEIMPDHFNKVYFNWIDNLQDWCISRQILYGHRIPVWYKNEEIYCSIEAPEGDNWTQDTDTLDTWFSSSLWTFSTLGWPEMTKDLETYHPTAFMNPGYEILFFWVARMIMMSQYLLDQIPFNTVYIHGIVRDKTGKKFSKSLKNGIEPEEVINQYGTDALRMSMLVGNGPGSDITFDMQKIKGYKNFANKLWNIARFVLSNCADFDGDIEMNASLLSESLNEKQKIQLQEFSALIHEATEEMERYRFHLVAEKLYHYVWHVFADIIIEESKEELTGDNRRATQWFLLYLLETNLKLLHPFMPFVTEELWSLVPHTSKNLLMVEKWPA